MVNLNVKDFEDFNEFSDSSFSFDYRNEVSKNILQDLILENENNKCDYLSDNWIIINNHIKSYFDFNLVVNSIRFYKHLDHPLFKDVIKNWIAANLARFSPKRVRDSYSILLKFIELSEGFSSSLNTIECVEVNLKSMDARARYNISVFMLNFLNYYEDIDEDGAYTKLLIAVKNTVSSKELDNVRILPRPKDLLIFNYIINDFFGNVKNDSYLYHLYSPILLWWRLTTLIPLRPFEFCNIKRDGLKNENGEFYIKLPRSDAKGVKKKGKNNIQIIDTIAITEDIYLLFLEYFDKTERFGETNTFLSYKSLSWAYSVVNGSGAGARDKENFTYSTLRKLLINFYKKVVEGTYSLSVKPWEKQMEDSKKLKRENYKKNRELLQLVKEDDNQYLINRHLRLGDTRHIALMNMQRLGYHPVEMARLAGHTNLRTQTHYHSHQLKWIDTEILKLMSDLKLQKLRLIDDSTIASGFTGGEIKNEYETDTEWKDKFVFKSNDSFEREVKEKKLELGYCTDENQSCPVDDCACGCEYWGISIEEYRNKKDLIMQKIKRVNDTLIYVVTELVNLHNYAINNHGEPSVAENNLRFNSELLSKSKEIDKSIAQLIELKTIEERKF
ncbi:hypothetical protein ACDZ29_25575 [Peribacillus sp. RS7]|uniref:hypothetical protein n=1 Tax=Peribacillus sp. RS7 TaxID=3242679 RepID=UPI0035BFE14A